MKAIRKITVFISIIILTAIVFLWYMGFFATLRIEEKEEGGYLVAGIEVIGPYSEAGKYINDVELRLKEIGITSNKGFGIYYDNPKTTPPEECRSLVGVILKKEDLEKTDLTKLKGLQTDSIPSKKALVTEFPIKNMMSYMLGPIKVYPVFSKEMIKMNYTPTLSFEIYDSIENKITYVMQYSLKE